MLIKAVKRDVKENIDTLRKEGKIPAVFYGAGRESTPITVPVVEFKKIWREAGESSMVQVAVGTDKVDVLIHEVQVDPIKSEPIHVDFLAIDMTKKITVEVELVFEGVSEAVKSGIGNLIKVLHEIEIEALPKDLPHNLVVDISKLATLEDVILVSDIKLPPGVVAVTSGTDVVASIVEQVEEKEEEVVPVDLSTIEVEKKGKKEEEGEGAPEASEAPEKTE
ncbi:50S ribosomal protein L25 [Candidatus Nomurabacteria bacterium CG10_big_fil_rev_8_21_14_0_10_35_16]|uniref:Large ribosomal subunit protein bL25 n=1 Tax=Candidatus Nomurabacteria bacterium CG10_big_fil_rev_8_21_14_0_10_35_16 TaxID=1974731 RepID=A0A2H0TAW1_9BACT|nr:MAG: 50S ribosomal protein L25 [Candidatus Nomurabacteria bacterium CG10_big_fil_rev_8_21_14_0_10_35_16]